MIPPHRPVVIPDGTAVTSPSEINLESVMDADLKIPSLGPADVAIFWDYENVRIPAWCPPSMATQGIRNKVAKYGRIVEKRIYYDSRQPTELAAPRAELDLSGFTLVDCPSRNRKETLDKKLIVDVLCFAWERASMGSKACVVLITSDGDYSYAVARLRDIGVFTVVMYRPDNVAKVLIDNSNVVLSWEFDVLGGPPSKDDDESASAATIESSKSGCNKIIDERQTQEVRSKQPNEQQRPELSLHRDSDLNAIGSSKSGCSKTIDETQIQEIKIKQPNQQQRNQFILLCNVVLNAQYSNVKEGISVYSSWALEAITAQSFYEKIGEKNRKLYQELRSLGTQKDYIEWGRRDLSINGKPIVKVRKRDERSEGLSLESYLRLTYAGLAILKPNISSQESDWIPVIPKRPPCDLPGVPERSSSEMISTSVPKATRNLFVGGLAWQTTENSMHSYFRQFGPLEKVVVMHGRGFGFVLFKHANDAEGVLKHTEAHIVDKKIVDAKRGGFTITTTAFSPVTFHRRKPALSTTTLSTTATRLSLPLSVETESLLQDFASDIDALSTLRPPRTDADISAPFTLISAGSSYTRLWTHSTWQQHSRPPHSRYARHVLRWHTSTTARQIFPTVLISVAWAIVLSLLSKRMPLFNAMLDQVHGSTTAVSLLTAPLALLLTLRANFSLSRLQEARALLGRLVLHCRTLSGLLRVYTLPNAPRTTMAAARHLALLGWSVKAFARGESCEESAKTFSTLLDDATTNWLIQGDLSNGLSLPANDPNNRLPKYQPPSRIALTGRLRKLCAIALDESEQCTGSCLTTPQLLIEEQIVNLEQIVGGCERLHSSPIPPTYSRHLSRVMSMFLFFMPVGLVASSMSLINTVLISTIASYVFVGIDEVGMEVENAFSLLPLQQLASAAHVGVRDQLVSLNDAPSLP
ncbi:bestrophin, RFP-TM, chloride channel [Nitzschia inconspicua]|uniref:Bestrophin, RFP-TM, chloride channel n=1 Tax=Nitzschia inconspicua TaxID=303405 RepID=A0A9K3PEP8_9STRA|nr:bestrophin, RFP-TM, chloride channel [Nitzschia inconspicua]